MLKDCLIFCERGKSLFGRLLGHRPSSWYSTRSTPPGRRARSALCWLPWCCPRMPVPCLVKSHYTRPGVKSAWPPPGTTTMPKQALVLIDIQNDYFPGGKWTLRGIESAADNAAKLLAAARAAGDLVIHVRHEFPTADAPFFTPGSP